MAEHDVSFSVPKRVLGNPDVEFYVTRDGERFGTLKVSKGAVVWFPRGAHRGRKISWRKFDELMQEHGRIRGRR